MLTLFSFGPNFGVIDPSPFVLKIDLYLRMAKIPFEVVTGVNNLQKSPKGKLPFIRDEECIIADSFFIQDYLQNQKGATLDHHLSAEQQAIAHLIIKSLDENFYWTIVYSRWVRDDTWPLIKHAFFSNMPWPLKYIVPTIARKGTKDALFKHGLGKHNDVEIMQIADATLVSLSNLLADKPYIFGDKPCSLDAAIFANLAQLIIVDIDNPLCRLARSYDNLVAYCRRINQKYYFPLNSINDTPQP